MKYKNYLSAAVIVAVLSFCFSLRAQTMPRKSSSPSPSPTATATAAASPAKQASRPIPFHGMVSGVDQKAKTFTIAGKQTSRVFKVTDKTNVTKGGNAASMTDIVDNEEVSGSYWKHEDGSLEAKTVKIGPPGEKKSKKSKEAGAESPAPSPPEASPKP